MNTINFKYSEKKRGSMAMKFLLIGIAGIVATYYIWFLADREFLMGKVASIFLALLGIGSFIYMKFTGNKSEVTALSIGPDGIKGDTTPIAKAAGLIEWTDITNLHFLGNQLDIEVQNPQKFADRMSNFFVRDTYLKTMKGIIRISLSEIDYTEKELADALSKYAQNINS